MKSGGFKSGEVKCTCGDTFGSYGEYLTHCYAVHHLTTEEVNGPDKQMEP